MTGRTSGSLLKFDCCREAFVRVAYPDGVYRAGPLKGQPKYSNGFGLQTTISGEPVKPGDTTTIEESFIRMRLHFDANDRVMSNLIHVVPAQHEWDGPASLFYQSGMDEIREVARWFNEGRDIIDIAEGILQWNYVIDENGEHVRKKGLSIRRAREELLMKSGDYGDISRYRYFDTINSIPEWRAFPNMEI